MKIRQAVPQDYPAIAELITEAFRTARLSDGQEQEFVASLRFLPTYQPELEYVAEDAGSLIGHVLLTRYQEESQKLLAPLCVAFLYRNQGIGTRLLQQAFARAQELTVQPYLVLGGSQSLLQAGEVSLAAIYQGGTTSLASCTVGQEIPPLKMTASKRSPEHVQGSI